MTSPESETDFPDISQPSFEPPPKSQRWLRLFIALVLIIGGAGAITSRLLTPEKPSPALANAQPPAVKVKLSTVQTGTVEDTTEYIANLESRQLVNLQPTIQGQVTQIFVRSGDSVSDGAAGERTLITSGTTSRTNECPRSNLGYYQSIFISPNINNNSQSIFVKSRYDNYAGYLRGDQLIRAKVIWDQRSLVLIPTIAVSGIAG